MRMSENRNFMFFLLSENAFMGKLGWAFQGKISFVCFIFWLFLYICLVNLYTNLIKVYTMREKKLRFGWLVMAFAMLALVSCDDSDDDSKSIETPKILQSEEIFDNPITLAFSWDLVGNAAQYAYQLEAVKESGNEVIVSGTTQDLNVKITSSKESELLYSTEYAFTLKAMSEDGSLVSEPTEVRVTTSSGAIALSIENMTYRSAVLKCVPEDKSMLYQFAQIPVEKYTAYDSDMAFIEGYDFGYYKAMGAAMPWIPWYGLMESASSKGEETYETRMLKPNQNYLFYAYGVEFNKEDTENPVKVVTPLIKHYFTTPEWQATSNGTFTLNVEGQELVGTGEDAIVNIKLKVTPSDNKERYYIAFVENSMLAENYDIYDFAFDVIYSEESYGTVQDWATTEMLSSGEQVLESMNFGWGLYPGTAYKILVFGVDANGLVTTSIVSMDCTTIGEAETRTNRNSVVSLKGYSAGNGAMNVIDRM